MEFLRHFSTREKNLWSEFLVDLAAGLYYYPKMIALIARGDDALTGAAMVGLITSTVMVAIFAGVIVSVFLHLEAKPEPLDERDHLFRARGNQVAYLVLVGCIVLIMGHVVISELMPRMAGNPLPFELTGVVIAHLLLVSLFLSSVAKTLVMLFFYRRGY